jgi:RecJ-like exonuclease
MDDREPQTSRLGTIRTAEGGVAVATNEQETGGDMRAAEKDRLDDAEFAFPKEHKEPLNDAAHVRNAIARFDQVEGVSDAERDRAWKRILKAAKKFGVEVSESDWRELFEGGKAKKS